MASAAAAGGMTPGRLLLRQAVGVASWRPPDERAMKDFLEKMVQLQPSCYCWYFSLMLATLTCIEVVGSVSAAAGGGSADSGAEGARGCRAA